MTTSIKQLKDEDGNAFYPQTVKAAVSDLGALAAKDTVGTSDIDNGAVTAAKLGVSHETWTFTLSDGTTVTKDIILYS